jgi:FixJ family two-component response regulator
MGSYENARIFVVDDEHYICQTLESLIETWGMHAEVDENPLSALRRLNEVNCTVFLLDIQMPGVSGFDLIPEIKKCDPDAKIIMMTGYADKETAITALQLGAFDFLEKPFQAEILYYTICRALDAVEKDRELKRSYESLKQSQSELLAHKEGLEQLNARLLETNRALAVLAKNFEREREEMEKKIAGKLRTLIVPAINRLRKSRSVAAAFETDLSVLVNMVEDLTTNFHTDARIATTLSFTELKIASMIKNGISTEEIARQLNISASTVRTHRKNIRKKLNINDVRFSLRNFLTSEANY